LCWFPVFYMLRLDLSNSNSGYYYNSPTNLNDVLRIMSTIRELCDDLVGIVFNTTSVILPDSASPSLSPNNTIIWRGQLSISAEQCCTACDSGSISKLEEYEIVSPDNATLFFDHPSCEDQVKFKSFFSTNFTDGNVFLGSIDEISSTSVLPLAINNTLTALYHAIRLDLGVIRPNQIYNSPTKFNASIVDVGSGSHKARAARDAINPVDLSSSTHSVHVPDILYLTPVFKLKPIAQAITAVFVSAFSMLTAIWAIFNFVASTLVTRSDKHAMLCPCPVCGGVDLEYSKVSTQDKSE